MSKIISNKYFKFTNLPLGEKHYLYCGSKENLLNLNASNYEGLASEYYFTFKDLEFDLDLIDKLYIPNRKIKFINAKLKGQINELNEFSLAFVNCHFLKLLSIDGCDNSSFVIVKNHPLELVFIENCDNSIFEFIENSYKQLTLTNCKNIDLKDELNKTPVHYFFEDIRGGSLKFTAVIISRFSLFDVFVNSLSLNNIKQNEKLKFDFDSYTIEIEDSDVFERLYIRNSEIPKIEVNVDNINYDYVKIGLIYIENTNNIHCSSLMIDHLKLTSENSENLIFNRVLINSMTFSGFNIGQNTKFVNSSLLESNNHLIIEKSLLGDLVVNPSFFHKFKKMKLDDSTISGIKLFGFQPIEINTILNAEAHLQAKIDFCRELSILMVEQGNNHSLLEYRALEHNLRLDKAKFNSIDWWILGLNKISNNHRTKPQYAVICLGFVLCIYLLLLNSEFRSSNSFYNSITFFTENFSYFFKPLSFISEIEGIKHEFSFRFRVFDVFYKVIYTFLVYQFIAAFRKFNK